jgi:hypothetical protein
LDKAIGEVVLLGPHRSAVYTRSGKEWAPVEFVKQPSEYEHAVLGEKPPAGAKKRALPLKPRE